MSIEEVAEHLGVTVRHVRRLVAERRIPFLKWGACCALTPANSTSGSNVDASTLAGTDDRPPHGRRDLAADERYNRAGQIEHPLMSGKGGSSQFGSIRAVNDGAVARAWTPELDGEWRANAAAGLCAWVAFTGLVAYEVLIEGLCPRCHHGTTATIPARDVQTPWAGDPPKVVRAGTGRRLAVLACNCQEPHAGQPTGATGCGAGFAVWLSWDGRKHLAMPPWSNATIIPGPAATRLGLEQERLLQERRMTELDVVRKAAENWRTGLGALLALLVAVFFLKGKASFDDIGSYEARRWLAALLLGAGGCAVVGAYRAVRAAHGLPSDEYTGIADSRPMRAAVRVKRAVALGMLRTPGGPEQYATVGAWRHAFARLAVGDLRVAKTMTVLSLLLFAAAVLVNWFAPISR